MSAHKQRVKQTLKCRKTLDENKKLLRSASNTVTNLKVKDYLPQGNLCIKMYVLSDVQGAFYNPPLACMCHVRHSTYCEESEKNVSLILFPFCCVQYEPPRLHYSSMSLFLLALLYSTDLCKSFKEPCCLYSSVADNGGIL